MTTGRQSPYRGRNSAREMATVNSSAFFATLDFISVYRLPWWRGEGGVSARRAVTGASVSGRPHGRLWACAHAGGEEWQDYALGTWPTTRRRWSI